MQKSTMSGICGDSELNELTHNLLGKKAIVTGATGGLGESIATELCKNGCDVLLTSRNINRLRKLRKKLLNYGVKIDVFAADFLKESHVQKLIEYVKEDFGNPDILINCAGVYLVKSLSKTSVREIDEIFAVNIRTPFILSKAFSQSMLSKGWGRIVNIGSSSSYKGFENSSVYCSTKHALLGFSRSLYNEFRSKGVRVYAVSPGPIKTPMGKKIKNQSYETFINPIEIAKHILFAISFDRELISSELQFDRIELG